MATLVEANTVTAPVFPARKRWTREEVDRLESLGLLDTSKRELIEGDLLDRMPRKRRHVNAMTLLLAALSKIFDLRLINVEAPLEVAPGDQPTSQP